MSPTAREHQDDRDRIATELESCVLGIVADNQPCTAYVVRRYLEDSLSSFWSASAGAIYPLMRRLVQRGWIHVEEQRWGSRKRRSFGLTRAGRQRLRAWLSPPVAEWATAFTYDPIRTRIFFLSHASPKQRLEFLDDAIANTRAVLGEHRTEKNSRSAELSDFDIFGREGAIAELSARLRWLGSVRQQIERGQV